jgi:hypothetical protein
MSEERVKESEATPVDDVRRVRERLARETGGNIRKLAQRSDEAYEALRQRLKMQGPVGGQASGR